MKKEVAIFLFMLLSFGLINAQNTLGTVTIDENVSEGYTLFTINKNVYLIDNCGQVINTWTSTFNPGNAVYLLEDGSILRAGRTDTTDIILGGRGGVIERYDWDGNLTWQFFYDTPTERQHHDIYPMPNGNVLILAATIMSDNEAIQAGRDPAKLSSNQLYNEQIIEVTPVGASEATIVWEWNINDHFIQDFDSNKDNFGNVSENPQLLDINYTSSSTNAANWLHFNSIQYDELLDQIVISSRNMSEIYIIDHTTTTAEAATGNGGTYGKGGDLLYRWGNPEAYKRGTSSDRQLFGQHFPHYIRNSINDNGKIIVFNNGNGRPSSLFSEVYVINPPVSSPGIYTIDPAVPYGPLNPDYIYTSPIPTDFYSSIISGAQRLSNGNTLIMEGTKGRIFEINQNEDILWEYYIPINAGTGIAQNQGDDPSSFANGSFRATKYTPDYPAFNGRTLIPQAPIENNPDISFCLNSLSSESLSIADFTLYPNPVKDFLKIKSSFDIDVIELYDISGSKILQSNNEKIVDLRILEPGIYFIKIYSREKSISQKIIKQ